jgi:hypothetical protein
VRVEVLDRGECQWLLMKMRARTNRVTSMQDGSPELMQRLIQDDTSGGELLVIDK